MAPGGTASSHLRNIADALKFGTWLSIDRLYAYSTLALAFYACVIVYKMTLLAGVWGAPNAVPGDFSQIWVAGKSVLQGHALLPYDVVAHRDHMRAVFGPQAPLYVFVYPPFCLAIAGLLALMPSAVAAVVEQTLMLGLYIRSIRSILPQPLAVLCALALPSVIINLGYGQLATLTAGLAGAAAVRLDRRPAVAGILFACMAYKPQLGVAIPVALIAGSRWRTFASGLITILLLVAASALAFGPASWLDFAASLQTAGSLIFAQSTVDWFKMPSIFAAVRLTGGSIAMAWAAQAASSAIAMGAVAFAWRRGGDTRLLMALLLVASLLCTPYCFEYDMVVFGPAIALVVSYGLEHGFMPWEKTLLAGIWVSPLFAGLAGRSLHIPLGALSIVAFAGLLLRARHGTEKGLLF